MPGHKTPGVAARALAHKRRAMDITRLVQAVQTLNAPDAFKAGFGAAQWYVLGPYLTRHTLRARELLMRQGDDGRCAFFVEHGTLQVYTGGPARPAPRAVILRAGALVGEPGLFGDTPRSANVEAMTDCVVWALPATRLEELCARSPGVALGVLRAAGAVMAVRAQANFAQPMAVARNAA
jgi:hypothetical protein